ncbi:MAG: YabP/YqfC family sporulation protein [Clostridia bacterium]|nr:YabP/YqfC family sporulation protein [Clostridia bacterium]
MSERTRRRTAGRSQLKAALGIPGLPDFSEPHLEAQGNREFILDGCRGILEYEQGLIRLNTDTLVITFRGENTEIKSYSEIGTVISGNILSVEFETQGSK